MTHIPKIYHDFYSLQPSDYFGIIDYYENNSLYFDNKTTFHDYDDFFCYSQVAGQYIISLERRGRFKDTIEYGDRFISVFNQQFENFKIIKNDFVTYWSILTSQGRALYELKDYKKATIIFKRLVDKDKKNDYLKNWLEYSKQGRRNSWNKYLLILAVVSFLISFIFENRQASKSLLILGFSLLLISLVNTYLLDKFIGLIKGKYNYRCQQASNRGQAGQVIQSKRKEGK